MLYRSPCRRPSEANQHHPKGLAAPRGGGMAFRARQEGGGVCLARMLAFTRNAQPTRCAIAMPERAVAAVRPGSPTHERTCSQSRAIVQPVES